MRAHRLHHDRSHQHADDLQQRSGGENLIQQRHDAPPEENARAFLFPQSPGVQLDHVAKRHKGLTKRAGEPVPAGGTILTLLVLHRGYFTLRRDK